MSYWAVVKVRPRRINIDRILDIDLDFFLKERPSRKQEEGRLADQEYHPWPPRNVKEYLICRCGLRREDRTPGKLVRYHHEVFDCWRKLIVANRLSPPFHVTHLDSHADMGMGDASCEYIMGELLHLCLDRRREPKRGDWDGLLEGNWISFALACRWIAELKYVHHPALLRANLGLPDIPDRLFKDNDPRCGIIQLKKLPRVYHRGVDRLTEFTPLELEPEVPVEIVECESFVNHEPYSFIFVTQSPNYTPVTVDSLLGVIGQFVADGI
jgi:hypothetical protein